MKLQMETKKQFSNPTLKLKLNNKFKSQKERKHKKSELNARKSHDPTKVDTRNTSLNLSTDNTASADKSDKSAAELNPIFIQSLLKESKLKVNLRNSNFLLII